MPDLRILTAQAQQTADTLPITTLALFHTLAAGEAMLPLPPLPLRAAAEAEAPMRKSAIVFVGNIYFVTNC